MKQKDLENAAAQLFKVIFPAGEERLELPFTVLETAALPLYYSPMSVFSPTKDIITQSRQSLQGIFLIFQHLFCLFQAQTSHCILPVSIPDNLIQLFPLHVLAAKMTLILRPFLGIEQDLVKILGKLNGHPCILIFFR